MVWKSDIDGYDIHVLVQHWTAITRRCPVLWFEFDPAHTLGDPADVARLIGLLAGSGRHVLVYDNLGRRMVSTADPKAIRDVLLGLSAWMVEQKEGHTTVQYVDVWALEPEWAAVLA